MTIRRLAVLTSGGDAPGMNAAIRSVVRNAVHHGLEVYGVRDGYRGLMSGEFEPLTNRAIGGIMLRGGTILGSARAPHFADDEGRNDALQRLNDAGIDGLIDVFNVFNHANFSSWTVSEAQPATFGRPQQDANIAYQPRMLQLGFRLTF